MSTAKDIAVTTVAAKAVVATLLENEDSPEFNKWNSAVETVARLISNAVRANDTMDELRYGLELRRELARHGRKLDEVSSLIRVDFLTQGSPWKRKRDWPNTNPDDIVGANFEDGTRVMFTTPIKIYRKTVDMLQPQYRPQPPKGEEPPKTIPAIGKKHAG